MVNRQDKLILTFLCAAALLFLAGCGVQHSNAPLLSAPTSATIDNDIYATDAEGRIHAIRSDGTEQWTYSIADDLARLSGDASRDLRIDYLAARSGGKLFGMATRETGARAGESILFALDANHLLWQTTVPFPEQNLAPIAVGQNAIYESGDDGVLYSFARSDGHRLWQYRVSEGTLGSPTIANDGTIYVTGPRHNLHAITPDGSQRWVLETQK